MAGYTDDKAELVARAMFYADDWHPDLWDAPNWEGTEDYRRRARAALAALSADGAQQDDGECRACGHGPDRHDPEVPGCIECRCSAYLWADGDEMADRLEYLSNLARVALADRSETARRASSAGLACIGIALWPQATATHRCDSSAPAPAAA